MFPLIIRIFLFYFQRILAMVTTNGVAHNNYYNMVQKEITMDELFA